MNLPSPTPPPMPPQPAPPRQENKARLPALLTIGAILLVYKGFYRWSFGTSWMMKSGGVVSLSFLLAVPVSCGVLSVAIGRIFGSDNWICQTFYVPGIALGIGTILCVVTRLEAMICVIMALPILIFGVVLGGFVAHLLLPRNRQPPRMYLTIAVFLPFLAAWAEGSFSWPVEIKAIENTVVIHAPAERIWPEIASVRAIDPARLPESWIYQIGFPRPIAATLDQEGVGGVRTATFERCVSFFETVTAWEKPRRLAFSIHADPDFIPHTAFDQHIIVGGRFYDVLDGEYAIEPLGPDSCRLHLTSHHRLSTRFNAYAAWWSVLIMNEIQGTILSVIRERAEAG